MGALLSGEVDTIVKLSPRSVVISGRRQIKEALSLILSDILWDAKIVSVSDELSDSANVLGMIKIYEYAP